MPAVAFNTPQDDQSFAQGMVAAATFIDIAVAESTRPLLRKPFLREQMRIDLAAARNRREEQQAHRDFRRAVQDQRPIGARVT
jgi:hypothetical protein